MKKTSVKFLNFVKALSMVVTAMLLFHYAMAQQQAPRQQPLPAKDTARTDMIQIMKSQYGEFMQSDSQAVHKLVGDVKLLHGSDTLYCDSAFLYKNKNSVEAFGNVEIAQADGTRAFADYMRYTGFNKTVYMKGGVTLESKKDILWSEQIDYNLSTKIGKYYNGGTLQSDLTLLTSDAGTYNVKTRDARFKGDVRVQDPDYTTFSEDLGYNTDTKVATFFATSTVLNDKSRLQTSNGRYDSKNKIAHFEDRSSMWNESQYIEGDTIDYDRNTGYAQARGRVIALDTAQKITLYSGYTDYNEINGKMWATINPLLKVVDGEDSLFMKADTFFAEPVENLHLNDTLNAEDSLQQTLDALRGAASRGELVDSAQLDSLQSVMELRDSLGLDITDSLPNLEAANSLTDSLDISSLIMEEPAPAINTDSIPTIVQNVADSIKEVRPLITNSADTSVADSTKALVQNDSIARVPEAISMDEFSRQRNTNANSTDSTKPRYFTGYHNVVIYSDSVQGKCDSISYSRSDSLMRMFYNPVLWSRNGQILGDTIYAKVDSSKIDWMYVPRNGIMINRNGPEKAGMYDQLQGNKLWAYFTKNKMDSIVAMPNAASIYFLQDEQDAYLGASEAKSEKIEIHFDTAGTEQKIRTVYYRTDVEQTMTPMKDVTPSSLRLSRFSWRDKERPKSLEEFLKGTAQQKEPELLEKEEDDKPDTTAPAPEKEKESTPSDVPSFNELLKTGNTRRDAVPGTAPSMPEQSNEQD